MRFLTLSRVVSAIQQPNKGGGIGSTLHHDILKTVSLLWRSRVRVGLNYLKSGEVMICKHTDLAPVCLK